ncbi:aspartic peptidase A1 [Cyathus striatus]|nr:aspartic peptidase A1 [Cyathus striatus]
MVLLPKLLASTLLCVFAIAPANPARAVSPGGITLSLSRQINATSMRRLVEHDRARAKALRDRGNLLEQVAIFPSQNLKQAQAPISEEIFNSGISYVATVGVGNPPTECMSSIDVSSNTWVGANRAYMRTNTSRPTSNQVSVHYGSGAFYGMGWEYLERVTLAPRLAVNNQSIGVAYYASRFEVDGILGIGPASLTLAGTLYPALNGIVPTVTTNLYRQGMIPEEMVSVAFKPYTSGQAGNMTWGGIDRSQFVGELYYSSKTTKAPARQFWGIDQSIRYGSTTILTNSAGIVDTGTTLIMIASDAFQRYKDATGAELDGTTGLLRITSFQYSRLQPMYFTTNGITYELTPNAQIWPRALNYAIGGSTGNIYLVVADMGELSSGGMDFINGYTFLERYYAVFNSSNGSVGFARNRATFGVYN